MYRLRIVLISMLLFCIPVSSVVPVSADDTSGASGFEYVVPCEWAFIGNYYEGLAVAKTFGVGSNLYTDTNGYCGYIDRFGKVEIAPVWDDALSFSEGLAAVKKDDYWGYINRSGELVIPCQFLSAGYFNDGCALIQTNDGYGFVNQAGSIISSGWSSAKDFSDGLALVRDANNLYGYIDTNGTVQIPPAYQQANSFQEGLAAVQAIGSANPDGSRAAGKWGYINTEGAVVIDFLYSKAESFQDGYAKVCQDYRESDQGLCIDKAGNVIKGGGPEWVSSVFPHGVLRIWNENGENYLYQMSNGYTINASYRYVYYNTYSIYDNDLEAKRTPKLDPFIKTQISGGTVAAFDVNFNLRISPDWDSIVGISENIAAVRKDGLFGYVAVDDQVLIEPMFSYAQPFLEGRAVVVDSERRYGVIRIENDGELYRKETGSVGIAYPITILVNNEPIAGYYFDGVPYVDIELLRPYGLITQNSEDGKNIFVTRLLAKYNLEKPLAEPQKESYDVRSTAIRLYFDDTLVSCCEIDGTIAVPVGALTHYGAVSIEPNGGNVNIYIDRPYLQNEGVTWEWLLDPISKISARYTGGYYIVTNQSRNIQVFNQDRQLLFEVSGYYSMSPIGNGQFVALRTGTSQWDYLNESGEVVGSTSVRPSILDATPAPIATPTSSPSETPIAISYPQPVTKKQSFWDGSLYGNRHLVDVSTGKYADEDGNVVFENSDWAETKPFQNGTALVNIGGSHNVVGGFVGGKWGLINTQGEYIVEPIWAEAQRQADGNIVITADTINGGKGIVDGWGTEITPPVYQSIRYNFGSELHLVQVGNQYGIINGEDETVLPALFDRIEKSQVGYYTAQTEVGNGIIRLIDPPTLPGNVLVNSREVAFDTPPLLINDRTLVPIRAIGESLGCHVDWIGETNTAVLIKDELRIEIRQDANYIIKNGAYIYSNVAAINYNSRIHVPLRAVAEAFGCHVSYDGETGSVSITS